MKNMGVKKKNPETIYVIIDVIYNLVCISISFL